jgi:hypothetical protein
VVIRIRKDQHHIGNLDPHSTSNKNPGPHQIYKQDPELDPNPHHQFADVKAKMYGM